MKGGVFLSQDQQLRFSVEESVWFQKGQEVSELLSISLDPDITIHEHDQYISIRGALQLTGEYKIDENADVREQFEYANVRYVNEVVTREDGTSILTHRFPVDITIPRNRIQQLEEVYVSIESFDYELPEYKCLKLTADLSISGISQETQQEAEAQPENETLIAADRPEEEAFEALYRDDTLPSSPSTPTAEIEKENEEDSDRQIASPFSAFYQDHSSQDQEEEEQVVDTPTVVVAVDEEEGATDNVASFNYFEEEKEEVGDELHSTSVEQDDLYKPEAVEVRQEQQEFLEQDVQEDQPQEEKEVQYSFYSKPEQPHEYEDEELDGREESDPKDAHYLTSLFAREDEEDFSRVKMCIVQQGDTLELISERYEISAQQILRVNNFHADQDVYEGQILYIPAYSTSK